jgi:hypothetical protein
MTLIEQRLPMVGADSLVDVIENRRWWRRSDPFPHIVAQNVLQHRVYEMVRTAFRELLGTDGGGYLAGHDIHGRTLTSDYQGPLQLFVSRPWHDLLARLTRVPATGDMNCGLHHHRIGSASGFPHNDLNPGWFLGRPAVDGIRLPEATRCEYTTGQLLSATPHRPRETTRAAAAIFYLDNPPWTPGDGGTTGLYRNASDPPDHPVAIVPPVNNSMLIFECTPFSYHGYIGNHRHPRNSIVLWLHRPREDAVRRWGEAAIVDYRH